MTYTKRFERTPKPFNDYVPYGWRGHHKKHGMICGWSQNDQTPHLYVRRLPLTKHESLPNCGHDYERGRWVCRPAEQYATICGGLKTSYPIVRIPGTWAHTEFGRKRSLWSRISMKHRLRRNR